MRHDTTALLETIDAASRHVVAGIARLAPSDLLDYAARLREAMDAVPLRQPAKPDAISEDDLRGLIELAERAPYRLPTEDEFERNAQLVARARRALDGEA